MQSIRNQFLLLEALERTLMQVNMKRTLRSPTEVPDLTSSLYIFGTVLELSFLSV